MDMDERPPRLKRLDRLFTSSPLYFVTANTEDRKLTLANATVHQGFRRFCENGLTRGVFVGKYVLMPDHLHMFVAFRGEFESEIVEGRRLQTAVTARDRQISMLSVWMKSFKNSLSKTLRAMNIPAPHWQKGFFDHVTRSEESYSEKWIYVAQNPVRKGLVMRPEDWPYQGEIFPLEAKRRAL